jgi:hypothetical protein
MYTLLLVIMIQGAQLVWDIPDLSHRQCEQLAMQSQLGLSFEAPEGVIQAAAQCVKKDAQL